MGHDIEAARAKAEASFRKPEHTGESSVARAEREVREQIERLRQLRLAKEARERLGAEIRGQTATRSVRIAAVTRCASWVDI